MLDPKIALRIQRLRTMAIRHIIRITVLRKNMLKVLIGIGVPQLIDRCVIRGLRLVLLLLGQFNVTHRVEEVKQGAAKYESVDKIKLVECLVSASQLATDCVRDNQPRGHH